MARKRHAPEQITRKLREAEVELEKGLTTADVVRSLEITEYTYYLAAAIGIPRPPTRPGQSLEKYREEERQA